MKMSDELRAMLSTKRKDPSKPTKSGYSRTEFCDTRGQVKLARKADRLLAKSGFFPKRETEKVVLDADQIGVNGLRPTWHGRA